MTELNCASDYLIMKGVLADCGQFVSHMPAHTHILYVLLLRHD